jgi:PAS domain S-box-containing protein
MNSIPDQKYNSHLLDIYGDIKRITRIYYWFTAAILLSLVAGIAISLSANNTLSATFIAIGILPVLATLFLVYYKKFEWPFIFLAITLLSLLTILATNGLGIHHISNLTFPVILIIASLVARKRTLVFLTLYTIGCLAWLVFGELSGTYTPTVLVKSIPGDFFSATIAILVTAFMARLLTESLFQGNLQLQKELRERKLAEEKYRNIFENAIVGIFQSTPEGRMINVNPAMARMYGYDSPEEMVNSVTDIANQIYIDPNSRDALRDRLEAGEEIREHEVLEYRKDRTTLWTSMNAQVVRDEYGNTLYYEGTVEDITERKQAEIERIQLIFDLAAKNSEAETLRESFATIVGTLEFSEIIQHILDQIKRVIPYDSASVWRWEDDLQKFVSGRNLPPMFQDGNVEFVTEETNAALPILRGEVPYILSNNVQETLSDFNQEPHTYINSWLAIPLKTRGKIVGLIALDGREKNQFKEYHAELAVAFANQVAIALENSRLFSELQNELSTREKLIKELESKNTELERFTYTISHDLKSPLVTINGFLGYLKGDMVLGKTDRVMTDIQRIQDAVDKMHLLLKELLELSRIGRIVNPPEKILFGDLAREALEIVHGQLEARRVTVQIQPVLPTVYGDRQRLIEVLQNLIDNATKYMGDQPAPHIEIGQHGEEGSQLVFFVKDNGMGINPQYHERIFGLFNKLDATSEGTGVGLALARRIIEVHGGRIWAESEPGKGSTFFFTLDRGD